MKIKEVIEQLKSIRINSQEMSANSNYAEGEENPWAKDVEAINIAIPILEKQSQLEAENKIVLAENKALAKLLDSANGALKRAGSKTQFMLPASAHDDNAGPVFKEPVPPKDTHVW
ncbi:hypothetical protein SDC9_37454 [bioreactor metagenome]|uniref:Uncharacterized protein n=1 Tax=bioreactor metagenome TaxID=1076179 RepID=A0A644VJ96_9ZZZZ|nr:hypothetical protein [Acidaminococcaceae bacterium]